MKLRHLLAASSIYSLLLTGVFAQSATKSLSGDNWKNPNRTKTWTPPANTDTLVGNSTPAVLSNKELSAPVISSPSFTGSVQGDLSVTGAVTSSNPAITSNTNISATTQFVKQSTSNLNSLVDGSFEGSTLTEWMLSTTGTKTIATSGCVDTPTNSKCMSVVSSLANILTNTWSGGASLPAKTSAVCEGWLKTDKDTDVTVTLGTSTIARQTITGDGVWRKFYLNYSTNGTDSPKCEVRNPATTNYLLDITSHGVKDETGVMAKFDNTSNKVPCTFSTLSWIGFGTVTTNNITCRRDRYHLVLEGNFVATGVTGSIVEIPLPTNYGTITIADTTSTNLLVGSYIKGVTSTEHGGGVAVNTTIKNNAIYLTDGGVFGNPSINGTDRATGTRVGGTISFVGEIKIPIAEWSSQTNAAIVACKEGPLKCTNTFVFKRFSPDLFALDQFGNSYPVTKGANTGYSILNLSSLGLANPMICTATLSGGSNFFGWTTMLNPSTNAQVTVYTVNASGTAAVDAGFNITCTKQGSDYNEAYDRIVLPKTDVVGVYTKQQVIQLQTISTGAIADLDNGNQVNFVAPAGTAITLNNAINGGVYNVFITDGTARTYTFTINKKESGALTVKCSPVIAATTASKHAMFTFTRIGNNAYCSWAGDL